MSKKMLDGQRKLLQKLPKGRTPKEAFQLFVSLVKESSLSKEEKEMMEWLMGLAWSRWNHPGIVTPLNEDVVMRAPAGVKPTATDHFISIEERNGLRNGTIPFTTCSCGKILRNVQAIKDHTNQIQSIEFVKKGVKLDPPITPPDGEIDFSKMMDMDDEYRVMDTIEKMIHHAGLWKVNCTGLTGKGWLVMVARELAEIQKMSLIKSMLNGEVDVGIQNQPGTAPGMEFDDQGRFVRRPKF